MTVREVLCRQSITNQSLKVLVLPLEDVLHYLQTFSVAMDVRMKASLCVCVCVVIIHGLRLSLLQLFRNKLKPEILLLVSTDDQNIIRFLFLFFSNASTRTHAHTHTYHLHEFGVFCGPSGLWMIPEVDISSHDRHQRITQLRMCSDSPTLTLLKATESTLDWTGVFLKLKICSQRDIASETQLE